MYFGFDNITVAYGRREVLRDLTLEIPRGKIVTLIGPNGCGKSSLLKTVSRVVRPTGGCVILEDRPLGEYATKQLARRIAYLAQMHLSPVDMDVRALISCGRYPYAKFGRALTRADRECIGRALAMTGLEELADRPLSALSGGELQRAWIAMCVAQEPEILILDEPTTYLDVGYQLEVLELVRRLNRTMGITILMVLHDLNAAARFSDLLCALKDRTICAAGTPDHVLTAQNLRQIFGIEARILHDTDNHCPFFIPISPENRQGESS